MAGEGEGEGNNHMSYDIDESEYDEEIYQSNYLPFIQRLRERLTVSRSHTIRVLAPQRPRSEMNMESLFYLHLRSGDRSIIVVLQQSNLYVRCYSRDGGSTYWAFSDSTTMIPGSQSLEFDGNYNHLEDTAGVSGQNLRPCYEVLQDAIITLANTDDPHRQQQIAARCLLILCQMIPEAARIRLISDHISLYWWMDVPEPLPQSGLYLENSWGYYSYAVQNSDWDVPPPYGAPLIPLTPVPVNEFALHTVRQAIAAFGLLLYHRYGSGGPRQKRDVTESSYARTLVCIEYIKINNIDGENPGDLYGTVVVTDCWGQNTVYDRSQHDSESKGPGQYAALTGPTRAINGADAFTIDVSLMDHDSDPTSDEQVAHRTITWDLRFQDSYYDKTVEEIVWGEFGNVTMGYSVITNALSATIKVVMINGDDNPAQVYGTIKAIVSLGGGSSATVSLFDKSSSESVDIRPGNSIPLTRSVIPAPVNSDLIIEASLWDYDTFSSDDEIANDSVPIIPEIGPGKPVKIRGKYGEVESIHSF